MCVVSMVTGHFRTKWPLYPGYDVEPVKLPTILEYEDYQELLRKARLYDEMMKQPDCPDPEKERWMAELERRMAEKYDLKPL